MSIDYGTKRIGIALSSPDETIAMPLRIVTATGSPARDAEAVIRVSRDYEPGGFVVGLPVNMDGSHGPQANYTLKFVAALQDLTPCPIEVWDERLSTFAADEMAGSIPAAHNDRARPTDSLAAQVILQAFLSARRKQNTETRNAP